MGERTIKVAVSSVLRSLSLHAGVSFLLAVCVWKLAPLPLSVRYVSVVISLLLLLTIVQLRFLPHMTVAFWTKLWGSVAPLFAASVVSLPTVPFLPTLAALVPLTLFLGAWAAYRFYPLLLDHRLHRARFARMDEIGPLLCASPCTDGLVLGSIKLFFLCRRFVCVRPTTAKKEIGNSLVIGPTGGGKGNHLETQILAYAESLIINDPKGDLFSKTAGARRTLGPVLVIDPTRGVGHSFDPLQGRTTEDDYFSVAKALVFDPKDADPFWADSAGRMIIQLFKAARMENVAPLPYLRHMIDLGLPATARRLNSLDPRLATSFLGADFAQVNLDTNRTLYGIWSTLQTRLTPFLTETLLRCFTRSDFTAETIMRGDKPVTVYLRWEEGELERLAPLVRVVCTSLVRELIKYHDRVQGQGCRPVLLCLDEIGRTPLPALDGFVATVRSRNIYFNLYAQSLSQLVKNYGEKEAQTINANMDTHVYLRPNDQDTAQSIEEWLGRGSQYARSFNFREGSEAGEGLSEQAIPVMTARAIIQMNDKYALIFHRDFSPMKVLRLKWWESKLIEKQHSLPPPELPKLPTVAKLPPSPKGSPDAPPPPVYINPDMLLPIISREIPIIDFTQRPQRQRWREEEAERVK